MSKPELMQIAPIERTSSGERYRTAVCAIRVLRSFPDKFEAEVSSQRGNRRNQKVRTSEDIAQGESKTLSLSICRSEFSHQTN
jgi:hypothetical protein